MKINNVGSVCSGIEAASVAWEPLGLHFDWFSEIAPYPSAVLSKKYPDTPNLGDMKNIPKLIMEQRVSAPDMICGGTPCQAFSFAGRKNGLNDDRGNLTLKFVDIVNANDKVRLAAGKAPGLVFWENVEGVLTDKTNAFGCLISSLAGLDEPVSAKKWSNAGIIRGPKRNVAWRVLDAKYFGVPQQRRRLYLLAGGTDFYPENILFEEHTKDFQEFPHNNLTFEKNGHRYEVFREYTDCLYSAYGTKWNGNAAANNGSLFVVQDDRIRRLSSLECERLMGFPDNYTDLPKCKKTSRYQVVGNSWAVPVVRWIGNRICNYTGNSFAICANDLSLSPYQTEQGNAVLFDFGGKEKIRLMNDVVINCTSTPEECIFSDLKEVIEYCDDESIFISPTGCYGIVRRSDERNTRINKRLKEVLLKISSKISADEIEKRSRIQRRSIRYDTQGV